MASPQRLCRGDCGLVSAVVRDMRMADDDELKDIQAAVTDLLAKHEIRMGGDLVTALCRWSETAGRHLKARGDKAMADDLAPRRRAVS